MEVKATKGDRSIAVDYDFGNTVAEAIEKFGEEVVLTNFTQAAKISLQALLRRGIDSEKTDEDIIALAAGWVPGATTRGPGVPLVDKFLSKFKNMNEEEKKAIIAKLRDGDA